MLFTTLFNIIYGILAYFVSLLPQGSPLPSIWIADVYTIWSYINSFSFIVPVDTLLYCLGIAMTFHLFIFAWKSMHWLYGLIRGYSHH